MVLDIDLFRADKGHEPQKLLENQRKRFKDVALVENVMRKDAAWRQLRHRADHLNKLKNLCSREIGDKMKRKEAPGDGDAVPEGIRADLDAIAPEELRKLCVAQIKKVRELIDVATAENDAKLSETEKARDASLREIGNILHDSVPISNDEDENKARKMHFSYYILPFFRFHERTKCSLRNFSF